MSEITSIAMDMNVKGIELLALPLDSLKEAKRILERKLTEVATKEFAEYVSSFFIDYKDQIIQQLEEYECKMPAKVKLEFEEEWNDGDATYPTISGIYYYDEDGNIVDIDDIVITYVDELSKREYKEELEYHIRENIQEAYSVRELEDLLGSSKVDLQI